jgi:hypothetical protein
LCATSLVLDFITIVTIGEEFRLNKHANVKLEIKRLFNEVQMYGISFEHRYALMQF